MVEIEFRPIKKVVVHEISKLTMDEFVNRYVKPNSTVLWADGILMVKGSYSTSTPKMMEDGMGGNIHWALIEFVEMPEFKPKLINEITSAVANVNDVSNNNVFGDFVRWLKSDSPWFPKGMQ